EEVRDIIQQKKYCGETEVILRDNNYGLANSILTGVTDLINRFGKIIVLEDDLVSSPGFLIYMNDALNKYENESKVMHVSGYMLPVKSNLPETFFYNAATCWGWGTWWRAWSKLNTDARDLWNKLNASGRIDEYTLDHTNGFDDIL